MSLKGDFGVHLVAYELMRRGWEVAINQGKIIKRRGFREIQGYDILAEKNKIKRKIEVKFIDAFYRGKKYKKHLRQRVTPLEYKICDYVIILVYGKKEYSVYIIPKNQIKKISSYKKGKGYTISIYYGEAISKSKIEKFRVKKDKDWNNLVFQNN